ncbi:MAG: prepilin-type N-terminal cleavage/methylation domain-containing protein [bacterium]
MSKKRIMNRRGFTLLELLIIIVIIAILAVIVIPRLMSATRRARESTMRSNLMLIRQAVEHFQSDTGVYPATLGDMVSHGTPNGWINGAAAPVIPGTFKDHIWYRAGIQIIPASRSIPSIHMPLRPSPPPGTITLLPDLCM